MAETSTRRNVFLFSGPQYGLRSISSRKSSPVLTRPWIRVTVAHTNTSEVIPQRSIAHEHESRHCSLLFTRGSAGGSRATSRLYCIWRVTRQRVTVQPGWLFMPRLIFTRRLCRASLFVCPPHSTFFIYLFFEPAPCKQKPTPMHPDRGKVWWKPGDWSFRKAACGSLIMTIS